MRSVVIWGCGGHGREVALVCRQSGIEVLGFLDDRPSMKGRLVDQIPVLGRLSDADHIPANVEFFAGGVGDPHLKQTFHDRLVTQGRRLADPIIHPSSDIGEAEIAGGVFVAAGCIFTVNVYVGELATVNRGANLSHDVNVGAFSTISPGVHVSGNVSVGRHAFLGVSSSIREKIIIGDHAVVGGGSFVAKDVPENATVGGVPARILRK